MLNLIDIRKTYKIGEIETKALDGISVSFRDKEFVAILGASGSGKTTCLNIIGGLDRYDSGEMTIKGKKTKDFKDKDWDAYRNNSIGFVFQSYNLITHLSIVANVELSLTLSGVSPSEKRRRAVKVLEEVGLKDHLHKRPNQLSGGQMQRVAIARALVNNPEILLCDEPTGALDTQTSVQILDLIKEVAKERLVIMVTHNPELATQYADRVIQFQDGKIVSDTRPHTERPKDDLFNLKKTSMSFFTALNLSFNNIRTKKGRTFLTAFASSIGIIGIAVILSLSTGFQTQIDDFQNDAMSEFPIIVSPSAMSLDEDRMAELRIAQEGDPEDEDRRKEYPDTQEVRIYDPAIRTIMHTNIISDEYIKYIENIDPAICTSIGYARLVSMNALRTIDGKATPINMGGMMGSSMSGGSGMGMMTSMSGMGLSSYPKQIDASAPSYLEKNYDLLTGSYPSNPRDLVIVVDTRNRINVTTMSGLGFDTENIDTVPFSDLIGLEVKLISNNDYYVKTEFDTYLPGDDYEAMYASDKCITLKVTGIVRMKEDAQIGILSPGIAYSDELSQLVIDDAMSSDIVKAQQDADYNIMSRGEITPEDKEMFLSTLGGNATPFLVMIYPNGFEGKDGVVAYLDEYNDTKEKDDKVIYTDLAASLSAMTGGIMDGITFVLIAFAAISLVVSLIMISIITYTSVLERTKEIGILKALGARKKDISRVFDAETCILGVFSGVLGIAIAAALTLPINQIIYNVAELKDVAQLQPLHAIMLVVISTVLTMLGGHIPARIASKKDAVEALRSE